MVMVDASVCSGAGVELIQHVVKDDSNVGYDDFVFHMYVILLPIT